MEANSSPVRLISIEKGGKTEHGRVISPESVSNYLKSFVETGVWTILELVSKLSPANLG